MSFDQVWPIPVLDFEQMCLGLAQIYPNGKNGQYIKCRSWWSLKTLYSNFFISSHQMGHLTKFDQSQSIGF